MELIGKIIEIFDTVHVSDKFRKREFAVETVDGNYTNQIGLETHQDKTALLDAVCEGQEVKVQFNLKGRAVNKGTGNKYYTSLVAWKIETI